MNQRQERVGGARVTAVSYLTMALGVLGVVGALRLESFPLFLYCFLLLFVATGVGNGSTYRMIPAIFRVGVHRDDEAGLLRARREAAAAIGIISAVGAFGGFLVPRTYGWSSAAYGSIVPALWASVALYVVMLAVTWGSYLRPGARLSRAGV